MYNFMISQHDSFVNDTIEGIAKVETEDYAFLLESTMNEYFTERKCDLMPIGNYLDSKGYGVGLQQNSIYRDMISDAILKLQEMQKIQILYNKWWRESGGAGNCMKKGSSANELGVKNVGGVFVVLLMGAILSAFVGIFEFVWKARKRASKDQQFTPDGRLVEKEPLCREMWSELKFALNCVGSSKRPVHRIRAEMKSTNRNSRNAEDVGFEEAYNAVQIPLNGMSFSSQNLAKHKRTLEREIYA